MNTVCIKCFSGMANAACAAIDSMDWDGVVGTIAGDDSILIVSRAPDGGAALAEHLLALGADDKEGAA